MEWLILVLLVPATVVPVVLLCGFAGCHFAPAPVEGGNGQPPTVMPPTVTAEPKNVDHIFVSWQPTDPNHPAQKYHYVRTPGLPATDVDASITTQDDTGLDAATAYTYQVSTIAADGTSNPTTAMASTFQAALDVRPMPPNTIPNPPPVNQPGFMGDYCFVQRISAGRLRAGGGGKVGIKVRGAPANNVTINRIYISQVGSGNPWNSAGDLTPVLTSALILPDAQPMDLDPVPYNLDKSQDLIIAFDFTASPGADTIAYVSPESGLTLYFKQGVQQASVQTRDPGYSTGPSQIYLVATIGVP